MFTTTLIIIFLFYIIISKKYRDIYIFFKTLPLVITTLIRYSNLKITTTNLYRKNMTVAKQFEKLVDKHPNKIAFKFEDQLWTFQDIDKLSNKIANYFKDEGLKKGDSIALLHDSCPEYVALWLGLAKIGVITAFINTNLVGKSLIHSVNVANCKGVIHGSGYVKALKNAFENDKQLKFYHYKSMEIDDNLNNSIDLKLKIDNYNDQLPYDQLINCDGKDKLLYIYTSGTTGLPKPAVITNFRFFNFASAAQLMTGVLKDDIIYNCLPLYHSSGGIIGVGQTVVWGNTCAIRKKFSASNYWKDCKKYGCTVAIYIGEICRYLLYAHRNDTNRIDHPVRLMFGNGLREQIWEQFTTKFHIKQVIEVYGSTEGTSNLVNLDSKIGAVGFIPVYLAQFAPVALIRCDQTGNIIRDENNFCVRCPVGEPGILVGLASSKESLHKFEGYVNDENNRNKLISNVFKKGDLYFNSGDILVQDEYGYIYFKDRIGDTFRWKGENVSTNELEMIIGKFVNYKDCIVYGVQIPETEGRAGMLAVLDEDESVNLKKLAEQLKDELPSYAVPIFLRIMKEVPITGTFKLKKVDLQNEGFDIHKIKDKLYFYDAKIVDFLPLTDNIYESIVNNKISL